MIDDEEITLGGSTYKFTFTYQPFDPEHKVAYEVWRLTGFTPRKWEFMSGAHRPQLPEIVVAYGRDRAEALARSYGHKRNEAPPTRRAR